MCQIFDVTGNFEKFLELNMTSSDHAHSPNSQKELRKARMHGRTKHTYVYSVDFNGRGSKKTDEMRREMFVGPCLVGM
jgi:hypothetical protein